MNSNSNQFINLEEQKIISTEILKDKSISHLRQIEVDIEKIKEQGKIKNSFKDEVLFVINEEITQRQNKFEMLKLYNVTTENEKALENIKLKETSGIGLMITLNNIKQAFYDGDLENAEIVVDALHQIGQELGRRRKA